MSGAGTPTYPVATIAKLLRLTERRVQQLSKEGVIPKAERGRYDLVPSVQGYIKYLQDRAAPEMSGSIDYNAEKARLTRANADIAEMEAAKMKGRLIDSEEVTHAWAAIMSQVRANLLHNVPVRVASLAKSESNETKLKAMVKEEIANVLRSLAASDVEELLGGADGDTVR